MPLLHHADALHQHWLRRQAIFLLFLTLHKLFIMQHFFNYHYYYYLRFALFFVHRKMIRGLRRYSASLHWPCYVTTSEFRALCSTTLGLAWGMEPCPASSSDHVINTEHINQLSRFDAQKLPVLKFCSVRPSIILLGTKLFVTKFLVKTLFVTHKFKYPVYLGAPLLELFLLHMIILV